MAMLSNEDLARLIASGQLPGQQAAAVKGAAIPGVGPTPTMVEERVAGIPGVNAPASLTPAVAAAPAPQASAPTALDPSMAGFSPSALIARTAPKQAPKDADWWERYKTNFMNNLPGQIRAMGSAFSAAPNTPVNSFWHTMGAGLDKTGEQMERAAGVGGLSRREVSAIALPEAMAQQKEQRSRELTARSLEVYAQQFPPNSPERAQYLAQAAAVRGGGAAALRAFPKPMDPLTREKITSEIDKNKAFARRADAGKQVDPVLQELREARLQRMKDGPPDKVLPFETFARQDYGDYLKRYKIKPELDDQGLTIPPMSFKDYLAQNRDDIRAQYEEFFPSRAKKSGGADASAQPIPESVQGIGMSTPSGETGPFSDEQVQAIEALRAQESGIASPKPTATPDRAAIEADAKLGTDRSGVTPVAPARPQTSSTVESAPTKSAGEQSAIRAQVKSFLDKGGEMTEAQLVELLGKEAAAQLILEEQQHANH